jgi:heme/copper-type cytochrome/quinol oxidase subunit 3
MTKEKRNMSLGTIAFLQAVGLMAYCGFIGTVMFQGNNWFNKIPEYFAPLIMLVILSTSALTCGLITLSYPFILFFSKKQPKKAVKLIIFTVLFLILFVTLFIVGNILMPK